MKNNIFSLDIGTRSVTGIILEKVENKYQVIDFCTREHKERSMLDGQIQNVLAVSEVIKDVTSTLEEKYGELHGVCVAAAGRALKTVESEASMPIKDNTITSHVPLKHLELSAVQNAQAKLTTKEVEGDYSNYYCVGYSIVHYKLDDEIIGSLIDQSGETATVQVIATFLPKVVVESLLAALKRANLEMEALTLEPIAAINVLIPASMRRLNIALVDIGAGTSDIALTSDGTITAYGMVPIAGDEITEAVSDKYLLDFKIAEEAKRNVVTNGKGEANDILGFQTTITYDDLVVNTTANVHKLADALTEEIFHLNKQAPKAIMLIGGGSLTPNIATELAQRFELPTNRVAERGIEAIQSLIENKDLPKGPEYVTPIGIAITAKQSPVQYISVHINDKVIRMFEIKKLRIAGALIQAGINISKFYGKPGLASIVTLNEEKITLKGEYGEEPTILLNNKREDVQTFIQDGDVLTIDKGNDGESAAVSIRNFIGVLPPTVVQFNNESYTWTPLIYVNDETVTYDYIISDRDIINVIEQPTVQDFLKKFSSSNQSFMLQSFFIVVNNRKLNMQAGSTSIFINNEEANTNDVLKNNDILHIKRANNPTVKDLLDQMNKTYYHTIDIYFNKKKVSLKQPKIHITRENQILEENHTLNHADSLHIKKRKYSPFIFQDIFRYVDLDLSDVNGTFHLYKNDKPTTFYEEINQGDHLSIKWK